MNNKKMRLLLIIQIITLLFITIIIAGAIYLFSNRHHMPEQVESIRSEVKSLEVRALELEEKIRRLNSSNYIPKDGINGKDGKDGKDSLSTYTIEKKTIVEQVPINGKDGKDAPLFEPRCNIEKNRWEYRYGDDVTWKVLNGTPTKCTTEEK